jgi:aminoglycoside 3-N-acetyltransferase
VSEANVIQSSAFPVTTPYLIEKFHEIGLRAGAVVLLHSSLSRIGYVVGGAPSVIDALLHVLTPSGTLMVPAHSNDNSDPSHWKHPPVPPEWWQTIRETMPPYHPAYYPTREMGRIADTARQYPGARRSSHPALSFAAIGAHADFLTANHSLNYPLGEGSPLARLYDLDGMIMLLGVGHENNTSLHLAEQRAEWHGKIDEHDGSAMFVDGVRQWVEYVDINGNDADFPQLGADYEREYAIPVHTIGSAQTRLFQQRPLIDYGVRWLPLHRAAPNREDV